MNIKSLRPSLVSDSALVMFRDTPEERAKQGTILGLYYPGEM
jgi:hypothetical protein